MRKLVVNWRKATDDGFPRCRTIEIEDWGIDRQTTRLEDAILAVKEISMYTDTWPTLYFLRTDNMKLTIQTPLDSPPTDEMIIEEIPKMIEEANKEMAKEAIEKAAEKAKKVADAAEVDAADRKKYEPKANDLYEKAISGDESALQGLVRWDNRRNDLGKYLSDDKQLAIEKLAKERKNAAEAAKEAAEEAARKLRHDEIVSWARDNGSEVLVEQLAQGFDGVSRYLREKIDHDFGEHMAELNNDGKDIDTEISNPGEDLLLKRRAIAKMLVEQGSYKTVQDEIGRAHV
jgi:hypothetical protein